MPNSLLNNVSQLDLNQLIMDNTKELIWAIDSNYILLLANKSFIEIIEISSEKKIQIGEPISNLSYTEDTKQFWIASFQKCFNGKYNFED
ncbi:MAG: hypothetical protein WCK02_17500 [Bacteroidota bacterium]